MKVYELIELLKLENPESNIWVSDGFTHVDVDVRHFSSLADDKAGEPVIVYYANTLK